MVNKGKKPDVSFAESNLSEGDVGSDDQRIGDMPIL